MTFYVFCFVSYVFSNNDCLYYREQKAIYVQRTRISAPLFVSCFHVSFLPFCVELRICTFTNDRLNFVADFACLIIINDQKDILIYS